MNSKITTFRSLMLLVDLDETDHEMKEIATLFVDALRDWGNCQNIVKCIEDFKAYFGNPLTVENTAHYTGRSTEDWAWRGEAGMSLSEMIAISTKTYNISDFDTIIDNFLNHYERKYLLTTKGKPISDRGYARFNIFSKTLTEADYLHGLGMEPDSFVTSESLGDHVPGLGMEPDSFVISECTTWTIKTALTLNINQYTMIKQIVKRLMPIKDRLIALKQANPDLEYGLYVVIWSSTLHLYLENDTLLFMGEIGAEFHYEVFAL